VGAASALGMVRGTDPRLAREVVLVTAPVGGAGSGSAGAAVLLQVAASLASLPGGPRRTVLLAALAGVEDERLGAEYLARHLPVERDRIVAHLSVEAWPALRPFTGVVARGADLSTLAAAVQSAATSVGAAVVADTAGGAGATAFARQGTPVAWLVPVTQGAAAPGTTWDWESLARLARLESALVRTVAQADARPRWTAPNPWAASPAGK
jgi:Zn-dependent M28 family amino/carboxypeptidase